MSFQNESMLLLVFFKLNVLKLLSVYQKMRKATLDSYKSISGVALLQVLVTG